LLKSLEAMSTRHDCGETKEELFLDRAHQCYGSAQLNLHCETWQDLDFFA